MDLATWTKVIGLDGIEAVDARIGEGGKGWILNVILTSPVGLCPQCFKSTSSRHMVKWQTIHDLPIAGQPLLLEMQMPQFTCEPCNKDFTVHPACVLEGSHVTLCLAEAVTDCVNVSTLSAAAATYHLPESTVKVIFEKIVKRRLAEKERTLKPMTKLGVDEIHLEAQDNHHPQEPAAKPPCIQPAMESSTSVEPEKKISRI